MSQLRIGTSGWNYKHWRERFYPLGLSAKHWLEYYSQYFNTTEVNYSFYRLPKPTTYEKWYSEVPAEFQFAVKCSRLITHNKRLRNPGDLWSNFLNSAFELRGKLGPILLQLPESFEVDVDRLSEFLEIARHSHGHRKGLRIAVEFRHESWLCRPVYKILEKHNAALVCADSSIYPKSDAVTADFCYLRYHGPGRLFGSNYSNPRLQLEARKIESLLEKDLDVYAYFNNDGWAFAIRNALQLADSLHHSKPRHQKRC